MRAVVFAVVLAVVFGMGCALEADLIDCGNGIACPSGAACDLAHRSCTTSGQIAACEGIDEGQPCSAPAIGDGACHDGVCLTVGCGNTFVDPGELCDDGNTLSGDGCAADCRSDERCGNGNIDLIHGESCDDGNLRSHDACSSHCSPEELSWRLWQQVDAQQRSAQAWAYDTDRRRLVLFGGDGFVPPGDTLEWDGNAWLFMAPVLAPAGRKRASMVYDTEHRVVVMFGGSDSAQTYGDTWTWDGARWRDVTPAVSPSPRQLTSMAYDPIRHRTVLFGGDTWEWDGTNWTELFPTTSADGASAAPMIFDPIGGKILLASTSTWLWDGTNWTDAGPLPGSAFGGSMAFDPTRQCVVLVGENGTWCWNGSTWTTIGTPAMVLHGSSVWFDAHVGAVLQYGGFEVGVGGTTAMWKLDAAGTWGAFASEPGPMGYNYAPLAYDPLRARLLLFGSETWESNGSSWIAVDDVATRPPYGGGSMTYDELRHRVVLVADPATVHEWDGQTWTTITPPTHPTAAGLVAVAYYPELGKTVMFGGEAPNLASVGEMWTWDGVDWTAVPFVDGPAPRLKPGLVYDPRRHELVLFGGQFGAPGTQYYGDTWVWTPAAGWSERQTTNAPAKRATPAMAYDPVRGEVLLYGGASRYFDFGDLWSWNGSAWTHRSVVGGPGILRAPTFVYDAAREQMILFGPSSTWSLQWTGEDVDDVCELAIDRDGDGLAGCEDPDCWGLCTPLCIPGLEC